MTPNFVERLIRSFRKDEIEPSKSTGFNPTTVGKLIQVGSTINQRFLLEAELGRGGMGIVYRARDLRDGQDVAVKIINTEKANSLAREQFAREARIMASLHHPHIVSVFEEGTVLSGNREMVPYIAMEYVAGTSLDNLKGLSFARTISLGKQICDALEYAHSQGIIHRDLKPANILIEKHGFKYFAKLADFGLAALRGGDNVVPGNNLAGTVFYLAPEVIAGNPPDVAADLYALGAMLYEMITGRVPFSNFFDDQAILNQHLEEKVTPPSHSRSDIPPALEAIILRLLAKKPEDRFATARDVDLALDEVHPPSEISKFQTNLPANPPEFKEDESQIGECRQLLETHALLTLLGDNQNLGLALGHRLKDEFTDGVWFIDFDAVSDPVCVLQLVVNTLGIIENPLRSMTVSLIEFLREKNALLILNRCDRVVSACAQLVEAILETCPDVIILATSSQPLKTRFEACFVVREPSINPPHSE